ncbi:MAG: hypothetical protein DSM107014_01570 [Gomphosphaeria aponina SAG 52.96 = DSM 107014]|uniref:Uncharacterized protein n=1 Tax=Gomphosphaeria aponina SAG 52.96 = DSM 107014 TaxID=1521640 RepID=A0A941JL07_9CHRO|nr:hypothetical protein [Gomphosphaeria aponina SAG 52.96 = DSM 107014]
MMQLLYYLVNNLQIDSNFVITHPQEELLEIPQEVLSSLEKLNKKLKNKYLCLRLRNFLHELYFMGEKDIKQDVIEISRQSKLVNNTVKGLNYEFYKQLHNNNCGAGYFDAGWQILRKEKSGKLAVKKNGLTVWIDPNYHLKNLEKSRKIGDIVEVKFPRNQVEQDFYLAIGDAGLVNAAEKNKIVEIYFNITAQGAVRVMKTLTEKLNNSQIPFTFKTLSNPDDYGRYDAAMLKFANNYYQQVRLILQSIYEENKTELAENIPLFTKLLAPGLGLAEEPQNGTDLPTTFGMNRFQILANALFSGWQTGINSPEGRMSLIKKQFASFKLEWHQLYLNPNSQDIYYPLVF